MDISESVSRILHAPDSLGARFYQNFFERFPEAERYFEGVNMQRQGHVLNMALLLVEQYSTHRYIATEQYLRYLGTQHSDREVPRELYAKWREAMLATLEQFHEEDWDEPLRAQWEQAIERVIELMFEGYETRITV